MAGTNLKLVNKLARRSRSIKEAQRGKYDRENKLEATLRKSPRAYKLSRKDQRRLDSNWGADAIAQKPVISYAGLALTLDRHDYSGMGDFGMRLTLAAGLEAAIGLRPIDIIRVLQGNAKGHELSVVALTDSTHIRLQDLASYAFAGLPEKTSVTCVADVAGSLNNKYWFINKAADAVQYYVWYNVNGAGVDPAIGGKTGVMVALSTGASAIAVATATASALSVLSGSPFSVSRSGAVLTVTNNAVGATTDASAQTSGFSISVLQQGANANPSPSESNINFLALLSSEKSSYV